MKGFILLLIIICLFFIGCDIPEPLKTDYSVISDYFFCFWDGDLDTLKIEFIAPYDNHDIKKVELWLNINPSELIDDDNTQYSLEVVDGAGISDKIDATEGFTPDGLIRYFVDSENINRWQAVLTNHENLLLLEISRENQNSMPLNTSLTNEVTWILEINSNLAADRLQNIIGNIYSFNFVVGYFFIEDGERVHFSAITL
ncbi:MAG: hypothetical protein JW822_02165 [Spirochaetales bacterium]|nr:hypothetical protein [Spirochaetales bacterium]